MMNQDKYLIANANDLVSLQDEVDRLRKLGFKPIGGIGTQKDRVLQAVVKYAKDKTIVEAFAEGASK